MEALQRQLTYSKKRTAFAWAKYYEELSSNHEQNINHYQTNTTILNAVDEVGGLKISGCGHKYCDGCFKQIDKCAICRRKINHK